MNNIRKRRSKHSVLAIDDHPIVRKGLIYLINQEPDLTVCRDAGNMLQAVKVIAKCKPDIIIIGISPCQVSSTGLIRQISHTYPDLPILIFSAHDESTYAERFLKAGAGGYIMKSEHSCNVISALRKILMEKYISAMHWAQNFCISLLPESPMLSVPPLRFSATGSLKYFNSWGRA